MPLGGSVTYGTGSSHKNGYRESLREILIDDGYDIEMVGSRRAGTMLNNYNEGWRGHRIDQIHNKCKKSVPLLLPDVFAVNAGSNDCIQNADLNSIGERMENMLECLWYASPNSTIVLSTLLVNSDPIVEARVLRANMSYRDLAKRKAGSGKRIVLVDMHTEAGPDCAELVDGTHPNDFAYYKMALLWREGFREALSNRFIR